MAFMQWFKCYADLKDHPKRWRFEELADTEYGLHYITAWFSYVCKFAPTGNVTAFTPKELARACEWKGDPQKLWDALLGAGFIDATEEGYVAHDWHEENGRFIRENERRKKPVENPRVTQGLPVRQDKTGQDKTERPKAASIEAEFEKNADFMRFWTAWPRSCRKGSPVPAYRTWLKIKPPIEDVMAFLGWKKSDAAWLNKDLQGKDFIPMPITFLNGFGWLEQKESGPSGGGGRDPDTKRLFKELGIE